MKLKDIIFGLLTVLTFAGCEKFLDRTELTSENDETVWKSEDNLRLYINKYYPDFFSAYGRLDNGFGNAPLMDFTNSDDVLHTGNQPNLTLTIPNSRIWNYSDIRSLNIVIDRINTRMGGILNAEAKAHWLGVSRFLRAYEYSKLVLDYGDVPYYDREVLSTERNELYKDRTDRDVVMDGVYEDLRYAMENVRVKDGSQFLDRYVIAGFVSRIALFEGTWQKYYYNKPDRARKFLDLAVEAGDLVIASGLYGITMDYKSQFTSLSLAGKKDVLLYREYDAGLGLTHRIATQCNLVESTNTGPTADLLKSYICVDGKPWEISSVTDAGNFTIGNLIQTRDSRLEATFFSQPYTKNNASLIYVTKFSSRSNEHTVILEKGDPIDRSNTNETDYPVLRYAEVLLNWVEAKAEGETLGGMAVTQEDLDKSVNLIRKRPLAGIAVERGVEQTAPLELADLPTDPNRDDNVPDLLWEIRRERRMEFTFEYSRLEDLRRWGKINYLDADHNPDILSGGWVDFPVQMESFLVDDRTGTFMVTDLNGMSTEFDGSNSASMKGFYRRSSVLGRRPFLNQPNINPYLNPVGLSQINEYKAQGYVLTQTEGWN